MIFTSSIYDKLIKSRSIPSIILGSNDIFLSIINLSEFTIIKNNKYIYHYNSSENIYYINLTEIDLLELISELCISHNYYNNKIKKIIIISNYDTLKITAQQSIKRIMDNSYENSSFIYQVENLNKLDNNIKSRCIIYSLPTKPTCDKTIDISYNKIIKMLKDDSINIASIRELSYMYYMNHIHSLDLQKYILQKIGSNHYLPNSIKYKIVEDICFTNKIYHYAYRKPILLEFIIITLHKHLENYTYNL